MSASELALPWSGYGAALAPRSGGGGSRGAVACSSVLGESSDPVAFFFLKAEMRPPSGNDAPAPATTPAGSSDEAGVFLSLSVVDLLGNAWATVPGGVPLRAARSFRPNSNLELKDAAFLEVGEGGGGGRQRNS